MWTEAETRKELIDLRLKAAGWDVNNRSQVVPEYDIEVPLAEGVSEPRTPYEGHQFSDYVLLDRSGIPVAVVEAKKSAKDPAIGREQAKQYCYNIKRQRRCPLPFCFYTNGHDIYFWDLENYPPRKVSGFPSREDLERLTMLREYKRPLADELISRAIAGRDYQIRAIRAVMEGIEKKKRDFLLVMATGTGKTRTCIALIDALMRSRHIQRTLFLVDRIPLRQQAVDAFKEYLPDEPRWPNNGERDFTKDRRIYVSTYPAMLNLIREESLRISPHFFDLIVVDESHRSIYNTYGEILEYFDTLRLGLTATPTDVIDHNTFRLFQCEDGLPTFAYTYEEAVNNIPPYLCNFQVMKIHTKFQDEGISKRTITLEDQKRLILEGRDIEEINFEGTELEKKVTNRGTNALIVREFMEESVKDPYGVLPGKTIFFCSSMAHARRMEIIFDSLYPEYKGELAKVIVSDDPRVYGTGGLLDQFKNCDMPRIALSVDMLDTGIDVREIVNLVFAKPVYSYTKFWQMIGRGTRLLELGKIKPWCTGKERFLIMDCWDNFEYFKLNPKGKDDIRQIPLPVRFAGIRLDKIEKALDLGETEIAHKEAVKFRAQVDALPKNSVIIQDASSEIARISDENFWLFLTHEKIEYLRGVIKPLFRTLSQTDFKAMRFEKDLLETSLARLSGEDKKYEALKDNIIEIIGQLPLSVNVVAREEDIIRREPTNYFWAEASDGAFDQLAERLSPLMKYIDGRPPLPGSIANLDLKDILKTKEMVEFGPAREAVSVSRYREMVEEMITELTRRNPILQKIRDGGEVSEEEARELAEVLYEERPHITEELLRSVYKNRKAKLIQFIRHILKLEVLESFPDTVGRAFNEFISAHSYLSSRQLEFLNLLKTYILEREQVQKRNLIESPFTRLHPDGIRGLFTPAEIEEIIELTRKLAA
jgi:type I restriction enzyme R subunit